MTTPAILETGRSTATAYHFKDDRFGWAICTVNDTTGELAIQSDWTDACGHRWNVNHLGGGATLTEFLAEDRGGYYDYLVNKLLPTGRREQFSAERTVAAMRRRVIDARRAGDLTRDAARGLWDSFDELLGCDDAGEFFRLVPEDYSAAFDDVYEDVREEPTNDARALETFILPALVDACRREVARRLLVAAHGPQVASEARS